MSEAQQKSPKKNGRPTLFSPELAEKILAELPYRDGGLEEVCRLPGMPSDRAVYKWLANPDNEQFIQGYMRARLLVADVQFQRALTAALTAEDANKGRLAYDARKWVAGKLRPNVYGDKMMQELTGANGGPIQTQSTVTVYMPENERDAGSIPENEP